MGARAGSERARVWLAGLAGLLVVGPAYAQDEGPAYAQDEGPAYAQDEGPTHAQDGCGVWPGEPAPLPRPGEPDTLRARWAELRVAELAERAQRLELATPAESQRLWQRILCIQPENREARAGVERTRPVRVYQPAVRWGQPARPTGEPWQELEGTIRVARRVAPRRDAPQAAPSRSSRTTSGAAALAAELETQLEAAGVALQAARFEEALERAASLRERLEDAPPDPALRTLHARVEVLAGTAQVALGADAEAQASFARALQQDPSLELDPGRTSPKVMRAFRAARGSAGGERP